MLIKTSGELGEGFYLFSLGESCLYALKAQDSDEFVLFDSGTTYHAQRLLDRVVAAGLSPNSARLIFLSSLEPERIAGVAWLKSVLPALRSVGSASMFAALNDAHHRERIREHDKRWWDYFIEVSPERATVPFPDYSSDLLCLDEVVSDGEVVSMGSSRMLRAVLPRNANHPSLSFYLSPHQALIGGAALGLYRGRNLPAPLVVEATESHLEALERLRSLPLRSVGLSYRGVLTGDLVARHLSGLHETTCDIHEQLSSARAQGVSYDVVMEALKEQLYTIDSSDAVLQHVASSACERLLVSYEFVHPGNQISSAE